jgi:hypothetical protein
MDINVKLTKEIVNECFALHYKYNPAGRKALQKLTRSTVIFILIPIFLIYEEPHHFFLPLLISVFAFGFYFFMRRLLLHPGNMVIKSLREKASFTMQVSEAEVITNTASKTVHSKWSRFTRALISVDIVLLYKPDRTFSMLHRSFFAPRDFEAFKTIVRNHVSPVIEAGTKF